MSLGGGGVIGALSVTATRRAVGEGWSVTTASRPSSSQRSKTRRTGPSPASTTRREPEPAQARVGLDQNPDSGGVDERDCGEIEDEEPRVALFGDGARQRRSRGQIQFAADNDRCHGVVALYGDLEGRIGLVARGHVEHLGSVGQPVGPATHRHSASVVFHRIPDACPT